MGVADHQTFDDPLAHVVSLLICYGNSSPVAGRRHASHDDGTLLIVFITILFDGTLTTGPDRTHARMPTEVRKVKPQGQTLLQQIVLGINFELIPIDNNFCHLAKLQPQNLISVGTALLLYVFFEVILKVFETTSQRRGSARSESTKCAAWPHIVNLLLEDAQILLAAPSRFKVPKYCIHPRQPVATRCAKTTRLMGKKRHEITYHPDRSSLVIKHYHGSGSQPASAFLGDLIIIEGEIQMLRQHKVGGATTG